MSETKISWTDATWNPVTGCSHVSPGCEHCYAEALSLRFGRSKKPWKAQFADENVVLHPERLDQPLHWRETRRVFVNSMSDLFHELVPFAFIDQVFAVMAWRSQHTFQILTKRPERMRDYVLSRDEPLADRICKAMCWRCMARDGALCGFGNEDCQLDIPGWPLPNVWLGTSIEDQRRANERIPVLLETPAAVRFLSCEPLLGPVDLTPWLWDPPLLGWPNIRAQGLSWVICGGESGPGYRFADGYLDAARSLRDQCLISGVPFFHKQSPAPRTEMGKELDGVLWEQYPDARVLALTS